ncbi:hypothetical protein DFS33DRAFT_1375058 [Desarmillaria ectypa]|nr:hypothetical protein DFS33DRAFT_1375058 [Desarmillaria ectypa]
MAVKPTCGVSITSFAPKTHWAHISSIPLTASVVEFATESGESTRYTATANREVIVTCVSDSDVLGSLGVDTHIDLKMVGKNVQEQYLPSSNFDYGGRGPSDAIDQPEHALGIDQWWLLPFSGEAVQISTTDLFTQLEINVNHFSVDWDLDVHPILTSPPLSDLSTGESIPGTNVFIAVSHSIGTLGVVKRSLGSVVYSQLKVYDTFNVRVIDASVGVAKKVADLVKASY